MDLRRPENPGKATPNADVSKYVRSWYHRGRFGVASVLGPAGAVTLVGGSGDVPGGDPALRDRPADGLAPGVDPEFIVDV